MRLGRSVDMKTPKPSGHPVDNRRYQQWLAEFSTYANAVTRGSIELWLQQFGESQDLAARLLDSVYFATSEHIRNTFRTLLNSIDGWSRDESSRRGRFFFIAFSGSAGESGDRMLHEFRLANNLANRQFDAMFVQRSQLVILRPGPQDTVVFIDDFAATGTQACTSWKEFFAELVAERPRIFLMLVAATTAAVARIQSETEMAVSAGRHLGDADNFFSERCTHFSADEKEAVLTYCRRASTKYPKGWGELGALVVFQHRCPNSSIAVLHSESSRWDPLFRR